MGNKHKKFFRADFVLLGPKRRAKVPKKAKNQKKPNILKTNKKFNFFNPISRKANKISEILKKISSKSDKRFGFYKIFKSKKRVASKKIASKIVVLGQKYNFPRKMFNCN